MGQPCTLRDYLPDDTPCSMVTHRPTFCGGPLVVPHYDLYRLYITGMYHQQSGYKFTGVNLSFEPAEEPPMSHPNRNTNRDTNADRDSHANRNGYPHGNRDRDGPRLLKRRLAHRRPFDLPLILTPGAWLLQCPAN